jgi:hypothetical protein
MWAPVLPLVLALIHQRPRMGVLRSPQAEALLDTSALLVCSDRVTRKPVRCRRPQGSGVGRVMAFFLFATLVVVGVVVLVLLLYLLVRRWL